MSICNALVMLLRGSYGWISGPHLGNAKIFKICHYSWTSSDFEQCCFYFTFINVLTKRILNLKIAKEHAQLTWSWYWMCCQVTFEWPRIGKHSPCKAVPTNPASLFKIWPLESTHAQSLAFIFWQIVNIAANIVHFILKCKKKKSHAYWYFVFLHPWKYCTLKTILR